MEQIGKLSRAHLPLCHLSPNDYGPALFLVAGPPLASCIDVVGILVAFEA